MMTALPTLLRLAVPSDCDEIYDVHRFAIRDACNKLNVDNHNTIRDTWLALLSPESYLAALKLPNKALWVIEYHNHIHGFFQLDLNQGQLDALYVHPFTQRQGLGTALLQRAEKLATEANLSLIRLYALPNSLPFYVLNGYQNLGDAVMPLSSTVYTECSLLRKFL